VAIVFGVLCVAAIAGVVYGVATHEEAGFADERPGWQRSDFPLMVCVNYYGRPSEDQLDIGLVLRNINYRLGWTAFAVAVPARGGVDTCPIFVTYGIPADDSTEEGGFAEFVPGERSCGIGIVNVYGELRSLVTMHELGHCLGLAHDDFDASIMRPIQRPTEDGQYPPRITDHDRQLLRETYGPVAHRSLSTSAD
jgi:hypothetical protein